MPNTPGVQLDSFDKEVTIVVLGASGDLASKKTFPALFALYSQGHLPKKTRILGYARTDLSEEEFHKRLSSKFDLVGPQTQAKADEFKKLCEYVKGAYDEDSAYDNLRKVIEAGEKELISGDEQANRLFYLALPPSVFAQVTSHLRKCVYDEKVRTRIIIEKPFGSDLESSRQLQKVIGPLFKESEIYRIDHYLGKEMVKNLLILRFSNLIMTSWWNNRFIKTVQITFKEPFGTEGRGGYFDDVGIIRDVMQNHLLQVLSLVAMERPVSFGPEDIRDEKVKVLKAIPPIEIKNVILGQYTASKDGSKPSYLDDKSIKNQKSKTPTYAAIGVEVHNERWEGVPFILKAGKALDESKVEIRLQLKQVAKGIFSDITPNEFVLRVQPNEAVYTKLNVKYPGFKTETVTTDLDLSYNRRFSNLQIPQAYESLILDALTGDHSNFVRDDELDEAWKIFTPLLHKIDKGEVDVEEYAYGSRGPANVDKFVEDLGYVHASNDQYSWPVTRGNL